MQQIADWLKMLGVSEYTDRFVENRIDLSLLPDLTDQDLEKLGVLLGDRRKMLRAARNLDNVSVAATAPAATVEPEPTRPDDAERRQKWQRGAATHTTARRAAVRRAPRFRRLAGPRSNRCTLA